MNIKLLWLLATGKLKYLRKYWLIGGENVDPLRDYIRYRAITIGYLICSVFVLIIIFQYFISLAPKIGKVIHDPNLEQVRGQIILLLIGSVTVMLFCLIVFYKCFVSDMIPLWKSRRFLEDVNRVDRATFNFLGDKGKRFLNLIGSPIEENDGIVPKHVVEAVEYRLVKWAMLVVGLEKEITLGPEGNSARKRFRDEIKLELRDIFESAQRLGIFEPKGTVARFYEAANKKLVDMEAEKSQQIAVAGDWMI